MTQWLFKKDITRWDVIMIASIAVTNDHFGWWNLLLVIPWAMIGQKGEAAALKAQFEGDKV